MTTAALQEPDDQSKKAPRAPRPKIVAELIGSDTCTALGIVARGNAPALGLCRKLIEAGANPATPLDVYRGDTLCLIVRSIGESARLELNGHGTGFLPAPTGGTAPPMRSNGWGAT